MIPRFTPCNSSPPAGASSSRNRSVMSATITSDWPTPTVSTRITSKPAASHNAIASRVRRATPPSAALDGLGRINAFGCLDNRSIRVLSPRIDPPDRFDDGSTARTATFRPCSTSIIPKLSVNVDFPTPGVPDKPIRKALRFDCPSLSINWTALERWSSRVLSTNVIARANIRRLPARTASITSWPISILLI